MKELKDMSIEELWQLFPIMLKPYNPNYKIWYAEEKQRLLNILHDYDVCRINHIGSTSVDGLIAKPIIDILLELPKGYDVNGVFQSLQNSGWILMQKEDDHRTLDLNKGYTPNGFAEKVYHLHVKPLGDWNELYFRDYLLQYPDVAKEYEALKQGLKVQYEHNRDAYTDAKSDFITEQSRKGKLEFLGRYLPFEH